MKLSTVLMIALVAHTTNAWTQTRKPEVAPTAATTNAADEIKKLEEMRNDAVLHGDVSVLDRMTSDDYTFVTLRGEMRTKQEILKGFASGSFHYDSRQIFDLKVRVYGDTAVVTGRSVQRGMENGRTIAATTGLPESM